MHGCERNQDKKTSFFFVIQKREKNHLIEREVESKRDREGITSEELINIFVLTL